MEDRQQRLQGVLMEKMEAYVNALEPEQMSPQTLKHLTGFLRDLRELSQDRPQGPELVVRFGGEESWRN